MIVQEGILIKITYKQNAKCHEKNTMNHALVLENITSIHPLWLSEYGGHQWLIFINNTIESLGYSLKKKSWSITYQNYWRNYPVKVEFFDEMTDKWKRLPHPTEDEWLDQCTAMVKANIGPRTRIQWTAENELNSTRR